MTIYLIRHGQSEFNAAFAEDPSIDPMIIDAPLTKLGRSQSEKARAEVAKLGIRHVICSPMTRAIQTALVIFDGAASITIDALHREQVSHSCDVGRTPGELSWAFPVLSFDHLDDHWWHDGPRNENNIPVEPDDVLHQRVVDFDKSLEKRTNRPIAIVGHGNFFKMMVGRKMENCEIATYKTGSFH